MQGPTIVARLGPRGLELAPNLRFDLVLHYRLDVMLVPGLYPAVDQGADAVRR